MIRRFLTCLCVVLVVCPLMHAQSQKLIQQSHQAKELMGAGKFEQAIPIYRELVKAVPGNAGLITNLGLAYHMAGHERQAVTQLTEALRLNPHDFVAELYLGYAYLKLGYPEKAIPHLEVVLKSHPADASVRGNLAEALFAVKRFREAATQFEKLSQVAPRNPEVWYRLGLCFQELAQQNFDELQQRAYGSSYWLSLVAASRVKAGQLSSAFYLYRQAIAKNPKLRGVHAALGEVYAKSGHADWAKTERAREAQLGKPDCKVEKYFCAYRAGRYEQLARLSGKTPVVYYWKTKSDQKLAVEALAHLGDLPESPQLHELLGTINTDERQFPTAVKQWQKAYELSGKNPAIGEKLVLALFQVQNFTEARDLLQNMLKSSPEISDLNYLYGFTLLSLKQPKEAVKYLNLSVRKNPEDVLVQSALAQAYLALGEPKLAIPHLKAALPSDRDGSMHYQLARAYQSSGKPVLARKMLMEYQKMHNADQATQQTVQKEVRITAPGPG